MSSSKSTVPPRNRGLVEEFATLALFFAKKRKSKGPLLESEIHELIENWKNTSEADLANLVLPTKADYMQLAMDCINGKNEESDADNDEEYPDDDDPDNVFNPNNIEDIINQLMANPNCPVRITPIRSCVSGESSNAADKTPIVSPPAQDISTNLMKNYPKFSKKSQEKSEKVVKNLVASCNNKAGPSKSHSSQAVSDIHHVPSFLHLPTFFKQGQNSCNDNNDTENIDFSQPSTSKTGQHNPLDAKQVQDVISKLEVNLEDLLFPSSTSTFPYAIDVIPIYSDDCLNDKELKKLESTNPAIASDINKWATGLMFTHLKKMSFKVKKLLTGFSSKDENYLVKLWSKYGLDPKSDEETDLCGKSPFPHPATPENIHEKFIGMFEEGLDEYKETQKSFHKAFKNVEKMDQDEKQMVTEVLQKLHNGLKQEMNEKESDGNCKNEGGKRRQQAVESSEGLPVQKKSKMEDGQGASSQSENVGETIHTQTVQLLFSSMLKHFNDAQLFHSEPESNNQFNF